jgi:hypothetical protein
MNKRYYDCREAFEKWHDSLFDISAGTAIKTEYGYPSDSHIQQRWQAWQAAWEAKERTTDALLEKAVKALELIAMTAQQASMHEPEQFCEWAYSCATEALTELTAQKG